MKRLTKKRNTIHNLEMVYYYVAVLGMLGILLSGMYVDKVLAETKANSAEAKIERIVTDRVIYKTRIKHIIVEPTPILTETALPEGKGQFISILPDYKITRQGSKQIAYVILGEADEQGLYEFQDKFMVAMGSYYGALGTCYRVTLSNDRIIEVIVTERKADEHTDRLNRYTLQDGSVLEFIVDESKLPKGIFGNVANVLGGYPVKIERIG